jgi:REP element-mobilizing transposase RayT
MLRGNAGMQLFFDDDDRRFFLERLGRYRDECDLELFAWCLMGNHVHLLVRDESDSLSLAVKKLTQSYAAWFNQKYDRAGSVFGGRYRRESVEGEPYLLEVFRYILTNPVRAGGQIDQWTSYNDYRGLTGMTDTAFIASLFSPDPSAAFGLIDEFVSSRPDTEPAILDEPPARYNTDAAALKLIKGLTRSSSPTALADMNSNRRNTILTRLKDEGISVRRISRLTGISRGIVQRAHA